MFRALVMKKSKTPKWVIDAIDNLNSATDLNVEVRFSNVARIKEIARTRLPLSGFYERSTNVIHMPPPPKSYDKDWIDLLAHEFTHPAVEEGHSRRQRTAEKYLKRIAHGKHIPDWRKKVNNDLLSVKVGTNLYKLLRRLKSGKLVRRADLVREGNLPSGIRGWKQVKDWSESGYIGKYKEGNRVYFKITPLGKRVIKKASK